MGRAQVDRTPKPCLHPLARHQHGERSTYVLDRCRCEPCTEANRTAERVRRTQQAYGRYDKFVDAGPVRAHIKALSDYGIGHKHLATLSGVSSGALTKIIYGVYAKHEGPFRGRLGAGDLRRGPNKRVLRTTADKILSVEARPENRRLGGFDLERSQEARRQVQALVALGWSISRLGQRLDVQRSNMRPLVTGDSIMTRGTVERIARLYAELSMTPAPRRNRFERAAATRAQKHAAEHGWLPPLAIDDEDPTRLFTLTLAELAAEGITDERIAALYGCSVEDVRGHWYRHGRPQPVDVADEIDEVAVLRRVSGDASVPLSDDERLEVVRRLHGRGLTDVEIEARCGISTHHVSQSRQVLGLEPNERADKHPIPSTYFDPRYRKRRELAS